MIAFLIKMADSMMQKVVLGLFYWMMIVYATVLGLIGVAWTTIWHPTTAFKSKKRNAPPQILQDKSFGNHEYVKANGIQFHYVSAGDKSKPLMLFLHGFPEFWFSWRYQLKEMQKEYHAVAVDMRGYGDSEHPLDVEGYDINNLVKDITELIPALGYSKCILVAHDWGGVIAWRVAHRHPELIERLVVMNCPHPKVFKDQITSSCKQIMRSWYMFLFQVPWLPELLLSMRDYRAIAASFAGKKMGMQNNRAAFTEEVVEAYKFMFSQPHGLTCPLNYYRRMFTQVTAPGKKTKVEPPTLLIWGEADQALEKDMANEDKYSKLCSAITVKRIPNSSHWVQQDYPDEVNQYIKEFLQN